MGDPEGCFTLVSEAFQNKKTDEGDTKQHPANESKESMNFGGLIALKKQEKQESQTNNSIRNDKNLVETSKETPLDKNDSHEVDKQ